MGLYYYNARWYDADTGRFISEDPARDGANRYVYTANNPLKFVDPSGMIANWVLGGIAGGVLSAAIDIAAQKMEATVRGEDFKLDTSRTVAAAAGGAVTGAITSGVSVGATLLSKSAGKAAMIAGSTIAGATGSAVSSTLNNAIDGAPLGEGVLDDSVAGATGGLLGGSLARVSSASATASKSVREAIEGVSNNGSIVVSGAKQVLEALRDAIATSVADEIIEIDMKKESQIMNNGRNDYPANNQRPDPTKDDDDDDDNNKKTETPPSPGDENTQDEED